MANRAYDLFVSSEVTERRQLIKLVLSNLRVEGKTVRYDALKPFNTILNYADNKLWLPRVDNIPFFFQKKSEQLPTMWGAVTNPQARDNKKVGLISTFLIMLPQPWITIPENAFVSILQTFQNLSYIGEMRQRWEEIKKLSYSTAI